MSRRSAFTLVELLVVITIIGMLMALLLPAVNAAVEAGRNIDCKNKLGQLAKATDGYQSRLNRYPGYENNGYADTGGAQVGSWAVELLPEIERQDLHDAWIDPMVDGGSVASPYLELMVCPSDPPEQIGGPSLSFVANSGFAGETYSPPEKATANGIFHTANVQSNVDSIVDGKSNTLLFSENIQATDWNLPIRNQTTFMWHASACSDCTINANKTTASSGQDATARPSSFHSGGVNVAFADTHVIFLKEEVDYGVYSQLMTPNYRASSDAMGQPILDDAAYR